MTTWRTAACPLNPGSLMAAFPRLVRNSQFGGGERADGFFPEAVAPLGRLALLQLLPVIEVDRARLVGLALDEAVVEVDPGRSALGRRSRGGGDRRGGDGGAGGHRVVGSLGRRGRGALRRRRRGLGSGGALLGATGLGAAALRAALARRLLGRF